MKNSGPQRRNLIAAVEARLGVSLQAGLHSLLVEAAANLVTSGAASDIADVADRLRTAAEDDPVVRGMIVAASVGETYFFRAPEQLDLLYRVVQERLMPGLNGERGRGLRVWSAACATGEEAYTLAMLFADRPSGQRVHVTGTDMNEAALTQARAGIYRRWSFRTEPSELVTRWTKRSADHETTVSPELRRMVNFQRLNLVTDSFDTVSGVPFDVVVLRNVLIYLARQAIPGVIEKIVRALAPAGVLVVTPTEFALLPRHVAAWRVGNGIMLRGVAAKAVVTAPVRNEVVEKPQRPTPLAPPSGQATPFDEVLANARAAAGKAAFDEALTWLQSALVHRPDAPSPHYLRGLIFLERGELSTAEAELRRALYFDRRFVAAELALGDLLRIMDRADEARRHFRRAAKLLEAMPPDATVAEVDIEVSTALRLARSAAQEGM